MLTNCVWENSCGGPLGSDVSLNEGPFVVFDCTLFEFTCMLSGCVVRYRIV